MLFHSSPTYPKTYSNPMASLNSADSFTEIIIQTEKSSVNKPESESEERAKPKLRQSTGLKIVSLVAFIGLLRRIRSRPSRLFRRSESESEVYNRLMDDLEDEEEPPRCYSKVFLAAEVVVLLGLVAAVVVTVTVKRVNTARFLTLRLWQWVTLTMVLVSGMTAIRFLTFLVFTPVKWRWRVHRYVVYIVEEIKWCVDMTLWVGLVLVAWYLWFRPRLCHTKGQVSKVLAAQTTRLLIALLIGSFFWTLKNALYLKLKSDLHYDQLYDRIRQTVIDFHGIQIIYREGVWKFLTSHNNMLKPTTPKMKDDGEVEEKKEEREVTMGKNIWMDVCRINKHTVPIWILHRLCATYLKQMKKVGLPRNRDATRDDQKLMDEAQQMLRGIIREEGRCDILPKDLDKYGLNAEERNYLFELFEKEDEKEQRKLQTEAGSMLQQHNAVISQDQFLSWAVLAYKNCWGLERTLHSSDRVFIKLKRILNTFLVTVMIIIWLLLSKIVDTAQLALLFTPFLAASFIFGDTSKKMFEGLIFTFAMHPFDVGDRVVIDNIQMKVTQLNILTSVFFKYDTGEELVYPNSLLASTKITNLDITPDQADSLEFTIPSSTPLEDITDLELKIKKALDDDITYSSQTKVVKKEFTKEDIQMVVYFKYLVSYLAAETKAIHRSRILTKIMEFNKEMESNVKKSFFGTEGGRIDFTLPTTVTIEEIDGLKSKMFESKDYESYKEHSKILMKGLDNNKNIEMVVYLRHRQSEEAIIFKKLREHVNSEIKRVNGQLKDYGAWSRRVFDQVVSLGRTSQKEGESDDAITNKHHDS